jgi:YjbE family integral membrane protein
MSTIANFDGQFWVALLQIIWLDLILSGDNAVVIALACRSLPERQRKIGVMLGAGVAVGLRIIFTFFVVWLMALPYLQIIGGLLLLWIGVKLISDDGGDEGGDVRASATLLGAVRTVLVADAVMGLDNVIAVAAAARGNLLLIAIGLIVSIPLVVYGATLLMSLIQRFPVIVLLGAGLIGFVSGEVLISDLIWKAAIGQRAHWLHYAAPAAGAALVIGLGYLLRRRVPARERA